MKKLFFFPLLMITCFCFAQNAKAIIGKPIKIANLLVAENDFPRELNWNDANKACRALGNGWRLPTKAELNVLYKNRRKIGRFMDNFYWSSTELPNENNDNLTPANAWSQNLYNGYSRYGDFSKDNSNKIRAVRFL